VFKGDIGIVREVDAENHDLTAEVDDRKIVYAFTYLDQLVLADAVTIHKS